MAFALKSISAKSAVRPAASRRAAVVVKARAGNWLPGSEAPAWLPNDLPGNFGFDPMGLAKDKASLARFTEAELIHCRWAMLGAAGALAVELLGFGNWVDAQSWAVNGGKATYFGIDNPLDISALLGIKFLLFAAAESRRIEETDPVKKCYPGGAFDPLGFSKDSSKLAELKLKEIKNGRLAMVACLGFLAQWSATGKGPLAALGEHIGNPWNANFATNGVSVPFF